MAYRVCPKCGNIAYYSSVFFAGKSARCAICDAHIPAEPELHAANPNEARSLLRQGAAENQYR